MQDYHPVSGMVFVRGRWISAITAKAEVEDFIERRTKITLDNDDPRNGRQLIRSARPVRDALKLVAAEQGIPLATLCRNILIEYLENLGLEMESTLLSRGRRLSEEQERRLNEESYLPDEALEWKKDEDENAGS